MNYKYNKNMKERYKFEFFMEGSSYHIETYYLAL